MADHFLESGDHKKYENTGLIFLGQKIRGLEVKMYNLSQTVIASQLPNHLNQQNSKKNYCKSRLCLTLKDNHYQTIYKIVNFQSQLVYTYNPASIETSTNVYFTSLHLKPNIDV